MRVHYGTKMEYDASRKLKQPQRWWKTACKRKTLAPNKWDKPKDITLAPEKVTCKKCLEYIGIELLSIID